MAAGDHVARDLEVLYARHRSGLLRAAERLLGDRAAAEDVVQETWLRALRFREATGGVPAPPSSGGREACPPAAWLYRVAVNLCYDQLRLRARRAAWSPHPDVAGAPPSADISAEPEAAAIRAETAATVSEAVAALPPALREVLLLREYGGFHYREIAKAVGCPEGTVMSRLYLARKRLQASLAPLIEEAREDE